MIALTVRSGASRPPCVQGGSTIALLLLASGPAVPAVLGAAVDSETGAVGGVGDITLALGPRPGSGGREGPAAVCEGLRAGADVLADGCGTTLGRTACNSSAFFGAGAFPRLFTDVHAELDPDGIFACSRLSGFAVCPPSGGVRPASTFCVLASVFIRDARRLVPGGAVYTSESLCSLGARLRLGTARPEFSTTPPAATRPFGAAVRPRSFASGTCTSFSTNASSVLNMRVAEREPFPAAARLVCAPRMRPIASAS